VSVRRDRGTSGERGGASGRKGRTFSSFSIYPTPSNALVLSLPPSLPPDIERGG